MGIWTGMGFIIIPAPSRCRVNVKDTELCEHDDVGLAFSKEKFCLSCLV